MDPTKPVERGDRALRFLGFEPLPSLACPPELAARGAPSLRIWISQGEIFWRAFQASSQAKDGAANPLDRFTRTAFERAFPSRQVLFPFEGPPYWPFQRWAYATGQIFPSPLGLGIHPRFGLWFALRAAVLEEAAAEVSGEPGPSPCDTCEDKPCLTHCPVGAFSAEGFAVEACRQALAKVEAPCWSLGCQARHACPVGEARNPRAQEVFHLRAFTD